MSNEEYNVQNTEEEYDVQSKQLESDKDAYDVIVKDENGETTADFRVITIDSAQFC